jgi:hypothetical protein
MFTAELLEGSLKDIASSDVEFAKPWLPSIAKLLNAYGKALKVKRDEWCVKPMLQNLGFNLRTSKTPPSAAELKQMIVRWLQDQCVQPPATINAFSLDAPSNTLSASELKQSTNLHKIAASSMAASSERAEIAGLRSEKTEANGRKLADAAIALRHTIRWLPRGGEAFLGISTETHSHSRKGVNQFALWLQGMELDGLPEVRMNCWESVFYTAYKANLISRGVARGLFADASYKGQVAIGEANRLGLALNNPPSEFKTKAESALKKDYLDTMYRHLKGPEAVDIRRGKEYPKKGDLVFFNAMSHVCICVGMQQAPQGHQIVPCLMSLWTQDNERYTLLPFDDLARENLSALITIHPCPF